MTTIELILWIVGVAWLVIPMTVFLSFKLAAKGMIMGKIEGQQQQHRSWEHE